MNMPKLTHFIYLYKLMFLLCKVFCVVSKKQLFIAISNILNIIVRVNDVEWSHL